MTAYEKCKNIIERGTYNKEFMAELLETFLLAKSITSAEFTELMNKME